MKKNTAIIILCLMMMNLAVICVTARDSVLIKNVRINLKSTESPQRLEIQFDLTEAIDLSQEKTNIIYEFFGQNDRAELEALSYRKDKTWAGYINSYDDYPQGERKYSSGSDNNQNYQDVIPETTIYTSVKTNANIDVTTVAAVKITVLRPDGSGEEFTVYSRVLDTDKNTGIKMTGTADILPVGTALVANEISDGEIYETIVEVLPGVHDFVAFDIKLESSVAEMLLAGNVQIDIPIPPSFNALRLAVYRIDDDGSKTSYETAVTEQDGTRYATFETDHFSVYVLLELGIYPYTVEYYAGGVLPENRIDVIIGSALFAEGHQLTNQDIETDIGNSWMEARRPVEGYNSGILQRDFPVISKLADENVVTVLYPAAGSGIEDHVTIQVEYQDASGNLIGEKRTDSIVQGSPYQITAHAIERYTYYETRIDDQPATEKRTVSIDAADKNYTIVFRYMPDRPVLNRISHDWYIRGDGTNHANPDEALTRGQIAMMFYRLIANPDKDVKEPREVFYDVPKDRWFAQAITYLYDYDILSGYEDKSFRPDHVVTRAEIAKIASMFDDFETPVSDTFEDIDDTHWAYGYIAAAAHAGWVTGYEDGTFRPDENATRAEMIVIINRLLNRRVKPEGLLPDVHAWADVSQDHWAYADIIESTHSHTFEREGETEYETWIDITETGITE